MMVKKIQVNISNVWLAIKNVFEIAIIHVIRGKNREKRGDHSEVYLKEIGKDK